MGQEGRRRAEKVFSWTAIAKKTLDLYHSLIPA
jgi:glycosyltransferase involved in cell wall biosynthesis